MTKLTTHCLDTFSGKPAKGIKVDVYFISEKKTKINSVILNNNGRSDKPLIEGNNFKEGQYELVFFVGDYFKNILIGKRFIHNIKLYRFNSNFFTFI